MIRIAICDDDIAICHQIEDMLQTLNRQNDELIEIEVFFSGGDLKDKLMQENYDILFLDIDLKTISGVTIGAYIREEMKNEYLHIVYISGSDIYAMSLFDTRPLHFLLKPISEAEIDNVFTKAISLIKNGEQCFEFKYNKDYIRVPYKDILYFESMQRKILIITQLESFEFYGKLSDLVKSLNSNIFLNVHQSYIINYYAVKKYDYDQIILCNGKIISISRSMRPMIRTELQRLRKLK